MTTPKPAIEVAGVRLTSPDKVMYRAQGVTKRDLADYYRAVSSVILPHLAGRPLTLVRCPQGQGKDCFIQRRASDSFPASIRRVRLRIDGEETDHLVVDNIEGLLELVQLGSLELHTWSARRDRLDRPDRIIMDLDPGDGVGFELVQEAALEVRDRLADLGLRSYAKTTGGKGMHVVAPLIRRAGWDEVKEFAESLSREMARRKPARYLATAGKADRKGRIYVDYLRNGWAATAIAAFSTRARRDAPVSVPLAWDEVSGTLRPEDFSVESVPERISRLRSDPWDGYAGARQWITREARRASGLN
jgi:bifunctional non-homologous end joining protein LigD